MDSAQTVAVWRPPHDRTADHDWAVQLRLQQYRRMMLPTQLRVIAVASALVAVALLLNPPLIATAALVGLLLVRVVVRYVLYRRVYTRLYPEITPVLAAHVPVSVKAEFVGAHVLSIDYGRLFLQLGFDDRIARQLITRAGEVWLAGPEGADAVVFAPGIPAPLPAQVVTTPERSEVESPTDDLTLQAAQLLARGVWIFAGMAALLVAGFLVDVALDLPNWWVIASLLAFCMILIPVSLREHLDLPGRIRRGGEWQAYPAEVHGWRGTRLIGELRVTITLPDGTTLPVRVPVASSDLVATIQSTGQLWVLGKPEARKRTVVGLPGYPMAASARYVRRFRKVTAA